MINYFGSYTCLKRVIDIIFSCIVLCALSPFLLVIACLIMITSPGPAFYKWKVVGKGGSFFTSYKFQTMYQNADELKTGLLAQNEMRGAVFKVTNDPRVTPLGRILRKFSIDELPQFFSVLKGDMSLVGPRPPLQTEYEDFNDWQKLKLAVKPGMTCLWQTCGRNEISDFDEWVKLDLEYIKQRSLIMDLKILMNTVKSVAKGTGK